MDELKIVITGCVGSGKTTAIKALSEIPVISTDVDASDDVLEQKDTTTVAMDYGEIRLADGRSVKLYGTPGQLRFAYMWEILSEGALGIIVLVNHERPDPIADLKLYLDNFQQAIDDSVAVIGVTHTEAFSDMDRYHDFLAARNLAHPIFAIDARKKQDVELMVEAMAAMIALEEEPAT